MKTCKNCQSCGMPPEKDGCEAVEELILEPGFQPSYFFVFLNFSSAGKYARQI